jgi:hypothetical protein
MKATIAEVVALAHPDYSQEFEIYTNALSKQLGAGISQSNWSIAFFNQKPTEMQQHYSVTIIELLVIVEIETLKEFKGMLWGQLIKVCTDHKNLIQDALRLTSDCIIGGDCYLRSTVPKLCTPKASIIPLLMPSLSQTLVQDDIHQMLVSLHHAYYKCSERLGSSGTSQHSVCQSQ